MTAIGVTGSRHGVTAGQKAELKNELIRHWRRGASFHHGDATGADAVAHEMAWQMSYHIVVHPPLNSKHRAWVHHGIYWNTLTDMVLPEDEYLARNQAIVNAVDLLIVVPSGSMAENPRSGTWACWRMAMRAKVSTVLLMPPGV